MPATRLIGKETPFWPRMTLMESVVESVVSSVSWQMDSLGRPCAPRGAVGRSVTTWRRPSYPTLEDQFRGVVAFLFSVDSSLQRCCNQVKGSAGFGVYM